MRAVRFAIRLLAYGALALWLAPARAASEGAGMPQLETGTFSTQVIWLIISFIVLFLLMRRVALPRIAQVLEERKERIADDLDKAQALKDEAEEVLAEYETAAAEGRAEAQAVLRRAGERLTQEAARRHEALSEKLAAEVKAAEERIAEARSKATRSIRAAAADVAAAATSRLVDIEVDAKEAGAAVRAAQKERG